LAGVTLIELLAVLAIAGALMAVFGMMATGSSDATAGRAAAAQVAGALDRARAQAIASGGHAAFVVTGTGAGEISWRAIAVFPLVDAPAGSRNINGLPFSVADAHDNPELDATDDPLDPVVAWQELRGAQMISGMAHGLAQASLVDAPGVLLVPAPGMRLPVEAKAVIFNSQGAVVFPENKEHRVARLAPTEWRAAPPASPDAAALPAVTIERFTGRIRILP
jgi:type II secretory pathway pseudopilin PulG